MKRVTYYSLPFLKSTVMVMVAAIVFISCKKDEEASIAPPPAIVIAGKWTGTFKVTGLTAMHYFSFNIKADGTLDNMDYAGKKIGIGTWQLNGATFTAYYNYADPIPSYSSVIGTLQNQAKLSGSWGHGTSKTNGGSWTMNKQ